MIQDKAQDNFSPVSSTVEAAESFFRRSGEICESHAKGQESERDRQFLQHAGRACKMLSEELRLARRDGSPKVLRHWQQYTPSNPLPGDQALRSLSGDGASTDRFLAELQAAAERFQGLHGELERRARTAEVQDFHQSYRDVLERFRRHLNSAYQQGQEL